jgi:hypothetical protein
MRAQAKIIGLENELKELKNKFINNKNNTTIMDPGLLHLKNVDLNTKICNYWRK